MVQTPLATAADKHLRARGHESLDAWLEQRRAEGLSAREISEELTEATEDFVVVSREAIRRWLNTAQDAA